MVDAVGTSPESMVKYINFRGHGCSLFVRCAPTIRVMRLRHIVQVGLTQRVVYNSIWFPEENEIRAIMESGIKAAILLGYYPKNPWAKGAIDLLRGDEKEKGLLKMAEGMGIEKLLIDTCVTNIPSIGVCSRAAFLVKQEFGLPVGFSPGNATTTWEKPKKKWDLDVFKACDSSAQVIAQALCCNFILYGPIEHAEWIFPATIRWLTDCLLKAAILHGPSDLRIEEVLTPLSPAPDEAIIKIEYAALCGTDLHVYKGTVPVKLPVIIGHEYTGRVLQVEREVKTFKVGDRIIGPYLATCGVCRYCIAEKPQLCQRRILFGINFDGAFAQFMRVPHADRSLVKLPNDMDFKTGVLIPDMFLTALYAVERGEVGPSLTVFVAGLGAIGLSAMGRDCVKLL